MPSGDQFDTVVKHLDITPITEATQNLSATRINKQPYDLTPVRDIRKLQFQIKVPSTTPPALHNEHQQSFIGAQYNYTAPKDFRIFYDQANNVKLGNCSLSIRYRIGTTVFRYFLGGSSQPIFPPTDSNPHALDPFTGWNMYDAIPYTNQLIKKNFVIEIWPTPRGLFFRPAWDLEGDILINTSILANPVDANQTTIMFPDGAFIADTLFTGFPEPLPTPNVDGAWLSN